jgi:hypothetical protein
MNSYLPHIDVFLPRTEEMLLMLHGQLFDRCVACAVLAWTGYPTSGTLEVLCNSYCVVRYPPI